MKYLRQNWHWVAAWTIVIAVLYTTAQTSTFRPIKQASAQQE